jgi:hypothetical protein
MSNKRFLGIAIFFILAGISLSISVFFNIKNVPQYLFGGFGIICFIGFIRELVLIP